MSIIAILPARKGSKRVPFKNRRELYGQLLINYTIKSAMESPSIDEIIVSTDDEVLAGSIEDKPVIIHQRDDSLATDYTSSFDVMKDVAEQWENKHQKSVEFLVMLQITTPLRSKGFIEKGIQMMKDNNDATCLIGLCPLKKFTGSIKGEYWEPDYPANPPARSQDYETKYYPSGSLYIFRYQETLKKDLGWGDRIIPLEVDPTDWVNIDIEEDFNRLEYILKNKPDDYCHLLSIRDQG